MIVGPHCKWPRVYPHCKWPRRTIRLIVRPGVPNMVIKHWFS